MVDRFTVEFPADSPLTAQGIANAIEEYMGGKPQNVIVTREPDIGKGKGYGREEEPNEDEPKEVKPDVRPPLSFDGLRAITSPLTYVFTRIKFNEYLFRRSPETGRWVSDQVPGERTTQTLYSDYMPLYRATFAEINRLSKAEEMGQ